MSPLFLFLFCLTTYLFADDTSQNNILEKELRSLEAEDFFISETLASPDSLSDSLQSSDSTLLDTATVMSSQPAGSPTGMPISSMGGMGAGRREGRRAKSTKKRVPKVESVKTDTASIITSILAQKATVAEVSSIDVTKSRKIYRSPQKALFMSLLLPGWGQAYSKSYLKTGLFIALEAGLIAGHLKFKSDGKSKKDDAHAVADKHFDTKRLETFYTELRKYGKKSNPEGADADILTAMNFQSGTTIESHMKVVSDGIYVEAGNAHNVQGWSDKVGSYNLSNPYFYTGATQLKDSTFVLDGDTYFGESGLQNSYNGMLDESEKDYDYSEAFLIGLVVNHVVSAADAFITAYAYNKKYMKNEETILSRISLDNSMELSYDGTLLTRVGLIWQF